MNFSIVPLYLGKKAKIYTICLEDSELSEYEKFVLGCKDQVGNSVQILDAKLRNMANRRGFIEEFFKRESSEAYNVYRIADTDNLRLFCIRYSCVAIILGNGGVKLTGTKKLNENPHLVRKVNFLIEIEKQINNRIKSKGIKITDTDLTGNLNFEK